ncbi:MAG: L-fuculose-phosphate aldolase [Parasphingorhabdus sp.]
MGRRQQLGEVIIEACLAMNGSELNQGKSGNISYRFKNGCLITPSGMDYSELVPDDMTWIDQQGNFDGRRKPSSEWRMHLDIYRRHKLAKAVVHAHPAYATALACLNKDIPAFHYMVAIAGGKDIRCAEYATFGSAELSRNMLIALKDRSACLLANHGIIAFGRDLKEALWRAGEVELLAKQYLLSLAAGEPVCLTDEQMDEALERFRDYGKQPTSC